MIRALKASSEAALEQTVEEVLLGVPYLPTTDAFEKLLNAVEDSLSNAGLTSPRRAQLNGQYAAINNGLKVDFLGSWPQRPENETKADNDLIVLAVEATGASLSMSLWHMECAWWKLVRQAPQSFGLGTMALTVCREQQDPQCLQELEHAIRKITAIPVDAGGGIYDRVGGVVVYGNGREDRDLNRVVRPAVREQYSERMEVYGLAASGQDGTYAASRGLAWNMWALAEPEGYQRRVELR
ncbi:hypothetical protein BST61_g6693 [Cercospora zeina]